MARVQPMQQNHAWLNSSDDDEEEREDVNEHIVPKKKGRCDLCDDSDRLFTPRGLIIHKSRIHGKKRGKPQTQIRCGHCNYSTTNKFNMFAHEQTHSQQKKVVKPTIEKKRSIHGHGQPAANNNARHLGNGTNGRDRAGTSTATMNVSRESTPEMKPAPVIKRMRSVIDEETESDEGHEQRGQMAAAAVQQPGNSRSRGRPRELVRREEPAIDALPGAGGLMSYLNLINGACALSNKVGPFPSVRTKLSSLQNEGSEVVFHGIDCMRGTIDQISFEFLCHKCRGVRGVARCSKGRPYCVSCCGHPECD